MFERYPQLRTMKDDECVKAKCIQFWNAFRGW